jgi:CRISPR/Cas system-associated exonuclease Cas4 (RecB family)
LIWTLDALFWLVSYYLDNQQPTKPPIDIPNERLLHELIVANWEKTELGRDWVIYSDESDPLAGVEYPTGVGRIDILARHREKPEWLVIEIKKDKSSEAAVGQILKYIGWIEEEMAESGQKVFGMLICREIDKTTKYAVKAAPKNRIKLVEYSLDIKLNKVVV